MNHSPGTLFIVATPIGNLADITFRAVEVLRQVDCIFCEDTRSSRTLLEHYHIRQRLYSFHSHNEHARLPVIRERLAAGEQVALISDAGTPLISDPGYPLVKAVRQAGYRVVPLPGACAAITALSMCGLPGQPFQFVGFLPVKAGARRQQLVQLYRYPGTSVVYEAVHRIPALLAAVREVFGPHYILAIARELTKKFEHYYQDHVEALQAHFQNTPEQLKGEFVLLFPPVNNSGSDTVSVETTRLLETLLGTMPLKQAVSVAATLSGKRKNELYQQALALKEQQD